MASPQYGFPVFSEQRQSFSGLLFSDWKRFVGVCAIQGRINYQRISSVGSQAGRSRRWGRSQCGLELLCNPVLVKGSIRGEGILNWKAQKKET